MKLIFEEDVLDLMKGSIDIHIHSAPDVAPRILNVMDLARHAQENGMKAIVLKNHFVETASQAKIVKDETGFPTFGGISLNLTVGGLNPYAVENALQLGAKIVWLPTFHSKLFIDWFKQKKKDLAHFAGENRDLLDKEGIHVLENGMPKKELYQIFDLIAKKDAILATGHVSVLEAKTVVREAAKKGIKRIIVTHPEARFMNYSTKDMKDMLDLGATYLEFVYCSTTRQTQSSYTPEELCNLINSFGAERCIMSTDSGQWVNPIPVQQMGMFIRDMLTFGSSKRDIQTMVSDNPSKILGI